MFVDRDDEHVLAPEDRLRPVAVVRIQIEDPDAAHAVALHDTHRDSDVVQDAKARSPIGMRVMKATRGIERVRHASAADQARGEHGAADRDRGAEEHAGVGGRLPAVDQAFAARIQLAQEREVRGGVHARELVLAGLGRKKRRESLPEETRVVE